MNTGRYCLQCSRHGLTTAASVARSQNSRLGMPAAPVARSFQSTLTGPQQRQTDILYKWMVCSLPEGKLVSAILTDWFLGIKQYCINMKYPE